MRKVFAFLLLASTFGCGADQTVTVGDKAGSGVVKSDINRSRAAAGAVSDQVQQGNKDMSGQ